MATHIKFSNNSSDGYLSINGAFVLLDRTHEAIIDSLFVCNKSLKETITILLSWQPNLVVSAKPFIVAAIKPLETRNLVAGGTMFMLPSQNWFIQSDYAYSFFTFAVAYRELVDAV